MNFVYLIDKFDTYCPENNNGSHIIGAFLNRDDAEQYIQELNQFDDGDGYIVLCIEIGDKSELEWKTQSERERDNEEDG